LSTTIPECGNPFRLILEDRYDMIDVHDSPQALDVLRSSHVDLVLLDVRPPEMDDEGVGASGRAILAALIAGEQDPDCLATLMRGRVKAPRADRIAAGSKSR
jgi:CheY-like chemotaxis protein